MKLWAQSYLIGGSVGVMGLLFLLMQLQTGGLNLISIWIYDKSQTLTIWIDGQRTRLLEVPDQCEERWPDLELFLTTPVNSEEYYKWFLPPLALFWPKNKPLKMAIITDIEDPLAQNFTEKAEFEARRMIPEIQVRSVLTKRAFTVQGWDKSQWLKMWANNFTDAEYVGFVDTDSIFVTRVTLNDLFVDGKPVVRAVFGKPRVGWGGMWPVVPARTFDYTGYKEPFNCMTYFPVVVKTAHLKALRERILNQTKAANFDQAFIGFLKTSYYSEYNMMCTIMWWQFRDEYYWVINETEEGWKGKAANGAVANAAEAQIPDEWLNKRVRPHLTTHWTYAPMANKPNSLRDEMRKGHCYSLTEKEPHPDYCSAYNRTTAVNELEFLFEFDNFSKRRYAFDAHLARIQKNEQCPHAWRPERVKELLV